MLDSTRYFSSFPDENPRARHTVKPRTHSPHDNALQNLPNPMSPELRAALEKLLRELEDFLEAECRDRVAEAG